MSLYDLFDNIDDDKLVELDGQDLKIATPISIHGDNRGNIAIEMHIPLQSSQERKAEKNQGGLCEHEHEILTEGLKDIVKKILDHRFANDKPGTIAQSFSSPVMHGPLAKNDIKAMIAKGIAMVQDKDKDKFDA
jgi:hypothetical protein